ncbi:uncharacterized protein LOC131233064 isoform X3 [Magnolia sinica]|uniref:uncharacterized protein LOC131233064 isoform X3 n=1 Tax=Magnolia sinica TaxID=86752 RepID=UPI0026593026|nr:uncharacterized protein LOC131233064 isoform X3 [Magnolia sinica]
MDTDEGRKKREGKGVYKIKVVQFFDSVVPIILQNANGPCPLIALGNILLLRKQLRLDSDMSEISEEILIECIADRLLDSFQNKSASNVGNEKQNIMDMLNLLPNFATGIDVNPKFRKIDDFELTTEHAIFDLAGIKLYHGWIVDPQDSDLLAAIGSKCYNTLVEHLVSLETGNAAEEVTKRGDTEEEEELNRVLELSRDYYKHPHAPLYDSLDYGFDESFDDTEILISGVLEDSLQGHSDDEYQGSLEPEFNGSQDCNASGKCNNDVLSTEIIVRGPDTPLSKISSGSYPDQSNCDESGDCSNSVGFIEKTRTGAMDRAGFDACDSLKEELKRPLPLDMLSHTCSPSTSSDENNLLLAGPLPLSDKDDSSKCYTSKDHVNFLEGDQLILKPDRDPMHQSEMALVEQENFDGLLTNRTKEEELLQNFLRNSQLTTYGLSCLKGGLNERELCVVFRNNHFSTMFKFNGELYILITDEGYANQPGLVWEKLNEVNGNSMFMTDNFKEFMAKGQEDYHASIHNATSMEATYSDDEKLARALQALFCEDDTVLK